MAELSDKVLEVKARLGTTSFNFDSPEYAHISIDEKICKTCPDFMCMYGCPAGCFSLVDGVMKFQYEDCVECGTCDIMCTHESVKWTNPRGSFGVKYKFG
ncbi:MAG: ferredoxin family protein [Thermoplasmatota archaeon]